MRDEKLEKDVRSENSNISHHSPTSHLPPLTSFGFTLVEVLVSIAIIGVAFGIIISSSAALQKSSRDTQRKADLRNIQTALQQYYADQNFYPDALNLANPIVLTSSSGGNPTPPSPAKTYMSASPVDPQPGSAYCYQAFASAALTGCNNAVPPAGIKCHYYVLAAKLEGNAAGTLSCGGSATYNFQLTPIP